MKTLQENLRHKINARLKRNKAPLGARWHKAKELAPHKAISRKAKILLIECHVCRVTVGNYDRANYDFGEAGWTRHAHQPEGAAPQPAYNHSDWHKLQN